MTGYLHVRFVEHDYDEGVEDECGQDDDGHDEPIDGTRQLGGPGPNATVDIVANVLVVALPKRVQLKSNRSISSYRETRSCLGSE